jgi:hypothetical protein
MTNVRQIFYRYTSADCWQIEEIVDRTKLPPNNVTDELVSYVSRRCVLSLVIRRTLSNTLGEA